MSKVSYRVIAAQISYEVVFKKNNLNELFKQRLQGHLSNEIKSSVKSLCYETIRHFLTMQDWWQGALQKSPKDKMVKIILSQGLTEFKYQSKPARVIVNEAVNTAKKLKKNWACGLINSTLRKATQNQHQPQNSEAIYAHPQWWIDLIKKDWPNHWQDILNKNNQKPPLWIRTKMPITTCVSKHEHINNAYIIEPQDIKANQDFVVGKISVQDASAQMAAHILNPKNHEKILDACSAPGGKACHLLEINNNIELTCLEIYPNRAKKIHENLKRLDLSAKVKTANAIDTNQWFDGHKFDKILLDVPCSASGIIRRQIDIKFNRTQNDLKKICQDQQDILQSVAQTLKTNGIILYATCSIFKQENSNQMKVFLKTHPQFSEIKLKYPYSINCEYGIQVLTGTLNMDGFYYCCLKKNEI